MTDQDIENEIQAAGADVAPRVTLADIEEAIVYESTFTGADAEAGSLALQFMDTTTSLTIQDCEMIKDEAAKSSLSRLTFCVLVLRNGFALVGTSYCAVPLSGDRNIDETNHSIARGRARKSAINKAWLMFDYALAERLYQAKRPAQAPEVPPILGNGVSADGLAFKIAMDAGVE